MTVKELKITNEGLTVLKVSNVISEQFYFKLVDGTTLLLRRDQAHLLKLWLEELLK